MILLFWGQSDTLRGNFTKRRWVCVCHCLVAPLCVSPTTPPTPPICHQSPWMCPQQSTACSTNFFLNNKTKWYFLVEVGLQPMDLKSFFGRQKCNAVALIEGMVWSSRQLLSVLSCLSWGLKSLVLRSLCAEPPSWPPRLAFHRICAASVPGFQISGFRSGKLVRSPWAPVETVATPFLLGN